MITVQKVFVMNGTKQQLLEEKPIDFNNKTEMEHYKSQIKSRESQKHIGEKIEVFFYYKET